MTYDYDENQHKTFMEIILEIYKSESNAYSLSEQDKDIPEIIDLLISAIDNQEFDISTRLGELIIPRQEDPVAETNEPFPLAFRNWLRYFSDKVCAIVPPNGRYGVWYSEEYIEMYNWGNIKKILQFYRTDFSEYLDAIRSARMSLVQLDQQFQLDLGENPTTRTVSESLLMEKLFIKRYLELPVVYWYDDEDRVFHEYRMARSEPYWSDYVQTKVFPRPTQEPDYVIAGIFGVTHLPDNPDITAFKEKVKGALKVVQSTIDEKASKHIDEGTYLEIMNQLKVVYDHCS